MRFVSWVFLVLICMISLLVGCGKPEVISDFLHAGVVDSELQSYIDRFYEEASARGVAFSTPLGNVSLVDSVVLAGGVTVFGVPGYNLKRVGRCDLKDRDILIQRDFFEGGSDTDREQIIFHELGHCLLGRDHIEGRLLKALVRHPGAKALYWANGDSSLMVEWQTLSRAYKFYRKEYLDALFEDREVDFKRALKINQPEIHQLVERSLGEAEPLIQRLAQFADPSIQVSLVLSDSGTRLDENIYGVAPENMTDLFAVARDYVSLLDAQSPGISDKIHSRLREICGLPERDPLCFYLGISS